jgi:hypothetical protein
MRRVTVTALSMTFLVGAFVLISNPADAKGKVWTITERQVEEQKRISAGEKSSELTKKEADDLRSDMESISTKIAKMKEKNGGKLSLKDQGKIEKSLNDVTLKIDKFKLAKRVTPH